jgi:hypothetical protein
MLFDQAFPSSGSSDEAKYEEAQRYLNSKDHRQATEEYEVPAGKTEKTIRMILDAEKRLGSAPDPLPQTKLYTILGLDKKAFERIMTGCKRPYSKTAIRTALRTRLYKLSPQRKPRTRKPVVVVTPEDATATAKRENPKWPCQPDCRCVRHEQVLVSTPVSTRATIPNV